MKRFAMIVMAVALVVGGIGAAEAQRAMRGGGGSMGGGGGWHGGGGGSWHGGGNWNGGGGNWHGGGGWHGGGSWHGGHSHSTFVFGVGVGWPYWGWGWPYYGYPYYSYYYPTYYYGYPYYGSYYGGYPYDSGYSGYDSGGYIEQGPSGAPQAAPAPSQPRSDYSYYCPDPAGYYPQVATCPKGWLRVVPQNAPGPTSPVY